MIDSLRGRTPHDHLIRIGSSLGDAEAFGHDLQLALQICYELHYRGFAGVDPRWEWDPEVLHLRGRMEEIFLNAMRDEVGQISPGHTAAEEMELLSTEPVDATGATFHLRNTGSWDQMREYFVHRSLYHLKEGDPHAWVIPRLTGQAKASFVAVEYDEYGAGRGTRLHQKLLGDLLDAAGLDSTYLGYIDVRRGRVVGCGQSDVHAGIAPKSARLRDRAFRGDRDHLAARVETAGGGAQTDRRA